MLQNAEEEKDIDIKAVAVEIQIVSVIQLVNV